MSSRKGKIKGSTTIFYEKDVDALAPGSRLFVSGIEGRFEGVNFPSNGRTFLYGRQSPGYRHLLNLGVGAGYGVLDLELTISIEQSLQNKITLGGKPECGIKTTRFLSFPRSTKEVTDAIDQCCTVTDHEPTFGRKGVVVNPQNLERLLDDDRFSHLWVIAYTVETQEVGKMQVATVFNLDAIVEVAGSSVIQDLDVVV